MPIRCNITIDLTFHEIDSNVGNTNLAISLSYSLASKYSASSSSSLLEYDIVGNASAILCAACDGDVPVFPLLLRTGEALTGIGNSTPIPGDTISESVSEGTRGLFSSITAFGGSPFKTGVDSPLS